VYWAFKEQLQYLDADLERHNFDWDPNSQVWYFSGEKSHTWFHDVGTGDLMLWT
jgi:beta-glucanase (GH16 family)